MKNPRPAALISVVGAVLAPMRIPYVVQALEIVTVAAGLAIRQLAA